MPLNKFVQGIHQQCLERREAHNQKEVDNRIAGCPGVSSKLRGTALRASQSSGGTTVSVF